MDSFDILGMPLLDMDSLKLLFFRFGVNILFAFVVIRLIYYRVNRNREFLFSLFLVNITVFFICIILMNVKIKTGVAFGLFAIFSILRYRTLPIPIKEMSFLFVIITIAVINSFTSKKISLAEIIAANTLIIVATYILEKIWLKNKLSKKMIVYEKIELIKTSQEEALINDLRERTGIDIVKYEVQNINFLRDTADIAIYYKDDKLKLQHF
tara:strand:+ start:1739 stop:2371 length:633 start_codon:yes stop_codon:yes gene_type:complete